MLHEIMRDQLHACVRADNWIPQKLGSAVDWSIDAWLMASGHPTSEWRAGDLPQMRRAFLRLAPAELVAAERRLHAESVALEQALYGDEHPEDDNVAPPLDVNRWKERAASVAGEIAAFVDAIDIATAQARSALRQPGRRSSADR